jgi:hypothetical protein
VKVPDERFREVMISSSGAVGFLLKKPQFELRRISSICFGDVAFEKNFREFG